MTKEGKQLYTAVYHSVYIYLNQGSTYILTPILQNLMQLHDKQMCEEMRWGGGGFALHMIYPFANE